MGFRNILCVSVGENAAENAFVSAGETVFLRHFYNKSRNYFQNLRRKSIKSCKKKVKKPYIIAVTEPAHIQACIKLLGKSRG